MLRPWEPLVERLSTDRYPRLLAHALMLAGDRATAEDLVQEALISTFGKYRDFRSLPEAEQYVRRAIVSRYVDRARRGIRERESWNRASQKSGHTPQNDMNVAEGLVDVGEALRALPPRQRACVALRYLDDLSIAQTASLLGLSAGAVKRYVSDGLRALNDVLGTDEEFEDFHRVVVEPTPGGAA